jgi:hypothetical protein
VKDGKIILFPDIDTQIHILGFRDKGEHYIEIPYDKFISEVTDIWEERTPIEGFKFDVEPIVYLKKMVFGWWRSKIRTLSCIF